LNTKEDILKSDGMVIKQMTVLTSIVKLLWKSMATINGLVTNNH